MIFGLVAHRHERIQVDEYIYEDKLVEIFEFDNLKATAIAKLKKMPSDQDTAVVYVTGLSMAMLAVVAACQELGLKLDAMHWCKITDEFYCQHVLN